jgi:D-amino-acid dehydrogenase
MKQRVAVVGAGITGVLTAYYLHEAGCQVMVVEKEPGTAMECTRANGGQLSVCNSSTWNTTANLKKGLKWMLQPNAPLLVRPSLEWKKLTWLAGFLRHTFNGTQEQNTVKTVELGLQARRLYAEITEKEGLFYNRSQSGILNVYTSAKSFDAALSSFSVLCSHGLVSQVLDPCKVLELEPALRNFRSLVGGIYTPDDSVGDAHVFTKELSEVLKRKGVIFIHRIEVDTIERKRGRLYLVSRDGDPPEQLQGLDKVVLANGYRLRDTAKELGDFLNIYPVKGYSVTINIADQAAVPHLSLLDDDRKIVCSTLGSQLRVAGTAELDGDNRDIRWERIEPLLNWVRDNFPLADLSTFYPWACHRPMSSDMMPIIRESAMPGVWYHGGHGHLGWTLGAATAKNLVENIIRQDK